MPTLYYALMLLLGLLTAPILPYLLPVQSLLVVSAVALLFLSRAGVGRVMLFFLLGLAIATVRMGEFIHQQLPPSLAQEDLTVDLRVLGPVTKEGELLRLYAVVLGVEKTREGSCDTCSELLNQRLRLSWRRAKGEHNNIQAGQICSLRVKLKRPRGFANFGGFDYQAWLLNQSVSATGYVRRAVTNHCAIAEGPSFMASVRMRAQQQLQGLPHQSILRALVTGDRSAISPEQWRILQATGTTHLMAISGLHVGLLAWFAFVLTQSVMRFLPFTLLSPWRRAVPALLGAVLSGFYALLSGFAVPSQRAWMLTCLISLAYVWGIKINPLRWLLYVAIVVLVMNPFASTQHGFWLSFTAVAILLYCFSFRVGKSRFFVTLFSAQWVIFVGLSVVLFARGLPLSGGSVFANIVAVPLVSFLVLPAALLGSLIAAVTDAGQLVLGFAVVLMDALWWYLAWLAQHSSQWYLSFRHPLWLAIVVVSVLLVLAPRALPTRCAGLTLLLVAMLSARGPDDTTRFTVLDVGQGLATVLETPQQTLVLDVGARFSSSFDMGSRVLAPYLRYRGRPQVDMLMISHGDNDHAGGLQGLIENLPVTTLVSNVERIPAKSPCLRSAAAQFSGMEGVSIDVLWPFSTPLEHLSSNDRSCVVLLTVNGQHILFTGDISAAVEQRLIASGVLPKSVTILVAPHHGSASSSSYAFIAAVSPEHVVFSAGYQNRYRHPAAKVVERYHRFGAKVWRTDRDGAIAFVWRRDGHLTVETARADERRPWYDE